MRIVSELRVFRRKSSVKRSTYMGASSNLGQPIITARPGDSHCAERHRPLPCSLPPPRDPRFPKTGLRAGPAGSAPASGSGLKNLPPVPAREPAGILALWQAETGCRFCRWVEGQADWPAPVCCWPCCCSARYALTAFRQTPQPPAPRSSAAPVGQEPRQAPRPSQSP